MTARHRSCPRNTRAAMVCGLLVAMLEPGEVRGQRLRITSPRAGATLRGETVLEARGTALPAGTTVEYWLGNHRVAGPDGATVLRAQWDSNETFDGSFALRALARDATGRILAQSAPVNVRVANDPASTLRMTAPAPGATLSGHARFEFAADSDMAVMLLVDGHDVTHAWHTPAVLDFDTTQLSDGEHEVTATGWRGRGPNDYAVAGMVQVMVTTANGAVTRALRHRYAELYLSPGETAAPAWSLVRCDDALVVAPGDVRFESSDPAVVAVDALGGLRAISPGEVEVRARQGDRVGSVRVIVDADRAIPHFAHDGAILHAYEPGRSFFVRTVFGLGARVIDQDPRIGPAAVAAGVNTLWGSLYSNPVHAGGAMTLAQWSAAWDANVWTSLERHARALDMSVLLVGDDVARTPAELNDTLTSPWSADALGHALSRMRDLHRVVGIEMVDEASFLYGPSPRPLAGAWSRRDPPLADDALVRLMELINRVPNRPNITWPVGGLGDPQVSHAWMGDPAFSDYASQYWTYHRPWRHAYPYGPSLPQDHDGMDDTVLARSYPRFRHIPQLFLTSISGPYYRKRVEGDRFQPGRDELLGPANRPEQVASQVLYALARGMAGVRTYTLDISWLEARTRRISPLGSTQQTGAEPFAVGTDRWQAMSTAYHFAALLEPWVLESRMSALDLGPDVVTGAREGARGRAFIAVNLDERAERVHVDLPAYALDPGGVAVRYRLLGASMRIEHVPAGAPDDLTLAPGEGVVWCLPRPSTLDVVAPEIAIRAPAPGSITASNTELSLSADAADERGPVRVCFFVDGTWIADVNAAPYTVSWRPGDTSRGIWHGLTAVATDAAGNVSEARTAFMLPP